VNFDSDLSEVALLRGALALRPARHLPPQGAAGATKAIHDADKRLAGKKSAQLDEARKLAFSPPGG
jgi:hypothetical protein